jgi:hypothetical protein
MYTGRISARVLPGRRNFDWTGKKTKWADYEATAVEQNMRSREQSAESPALQPSNLQNCPRPTLVQRHGLCKGVCEAHPKNVKPSNTSATFNS